VSVGLVRARSLASSELPVHVTRISTAQFFETPYNFPLQSFNFSTQSLCHRLLPTRHWLLTIRNLTRRASALTLGYDCYYSEADDNQTSACPTIGNAPDIPRIGTALFRRRKDHKVCDQITAVCHDCSDISLCGRWRTRQIPSPGCGVATNLSFH
jgi:hypothetical protein